MNPKSQNSAQLTEPEIQGKSTGLFCMFGRATNSMHQFAQWVFGGATMVLVLSLLAVFPFLNLISLGYLMKASGRVADTGRLRDGFIGIQKASYAGGIFLGIWLCCWPIRLGLDLARDAALISPHQSVPQKFQFGLLILLIFTVGYILWALARGGRLRHFLWPAPLKFIFWCRDPVKQALPAMKCAAFLKELNIGSFFKTGLAGFLGALAWLAIPVGIIYLATSLSKGPGILFSLIGGLLLAIVAVYIPFLQVQYVKDPHWKNLFNIRKVRKHFLNAPFAFALGLFVTLLFSIPLYLLKIELAPRELAWLPCLFFVVFIFPARLICGWATHRAHRRTDRAFFLWRWICRLSVLVIGIFYGIMVFFTQFLSWHGTLSLLEQHAFMVPAPWLSL